MWREELVWAQPSLVYSYAFNDPCSSLCFFASPISFLFFISLIPCLTCINTLLLSSPLPLTFLSFSSLFSPAYACAQMRDLPNAYYILFQRKGEIEGKAIDIFFFSSWHSGPSHARLVNEGYHPLTGWHQSKNHSILTWVLPGQDEKLPLMGWTLFEVVLLNKVTFTSHSQHMLLT